MNYSALIVIILLILIGCLFYFQGRKLSKEIEKIHKEVKEKVEEAIEKAKEEIKK